MRTSKGATQRAAKQKAFEERGGYYHLDHKHQFGLLAKAFDPAMAHAVGSKVVGAADAVEAAFRRSVTLLNNRIARAYGEFNKYTAQGALK